MEENESIEKLREVFEKNKGLKREMGPFVAEVLDDMNLRISGVNGWCVTYPAYTEVWAILMSWLDSWDEKNKETMETFIKGIVFPCCVRISDIDSVYVEDILNAHARLNERNIENKKYEDGAEDEG